MTHKRIIVILTLLLFLALGPQAAVHAHMGEVGQIMNRMMGPDRYNAVAAIDEQVLGAERYERMIDLMDKMMNGTLSPDEQKEIVTLMQDSKTAAGAGNMMQRMMMAASFKQQNSGLPGNYWDMMNNMMGRYGSLSIFGMGISIVWLLVGILLVIWLLRRLTNKQS